MQHTHAVAAAVAVALMTAGASGRIVAGPAPTAAKSPALGAVAWPQARRVLENIPTASLYLGLRMQGGRMYAVNGSGGADADVTPELIIRPRQATPPVVRPLPRVAPPLIPRVQPYR